MPACLLRLAALLALLAACDWLTFPCQARQRMGGFMGDGRPLPPPPAARHPAGAVLKKHEKNLARRG